MSEKAIQQPLAEMADENPAYRDESPKFESPNLEMAKTTREQVAEAPSNDPSDYDSADSYSDRENGSLSGSEDSEGSVSFEREEGDGQESLPAKKVDDDEDKKNPQYIPKRGTFYEHDDRTADDIESVEDEKNEKEPKKKVWQDKKEKWNHDRFNDSDQAPKSRTELIAIYGYDIRNEDGPPRARRRRRYGRGPNKYTRNWEDGEAYGKPTVIRRSNKKRNPRDEQSDESEGKEKGRNRQEYADEDDRKEQIDKDSVDSEKEERIPNNSNDEPKTNLPQSHHQPQQQQHHHQHQQQQQEQHHHQQQQPQQQHSRDIPRQNASGYHHYNEDNRNRQQAPFNKNQQQRAGSGRVTKPRRELSDSDYRGFTKSRQFKSSPSNRVHGKNNYNANHSRAVQDLEKDMGKMNLQDGAGGFKSNVKQQQLQHGNSNQGGRQGSVPPRLQTEQKGSKRYSSIRQRSLPETANPPPFAQHNFYGNEYNQPNQTSQPQQQTILTGNTLHPTNAQLPQIPAQTLPPIPAQVPVTTTPILQAPPQFAPPFTPAPPFLQPAVPPTTFIAQQAAPILNYVQGQPQYPQPAYQSFQQPFNAVNQPPELFQPQGGITYYSPQEQQAAQRAAPPKRPKAAIPIVAPPEHRGRGRSTNQNAEPPVRNTGERDVDNLILENKYEDVSETAAAAQ